MLRATPHSFTRFMVDAVTVRPFLNALLVLKRARVHDVQAPRITDVPATIVVTKRAA